jgi:hypothetical protein
VYETTAGAALLQVESFCRHLTLGGVFTQNSNPTRDQAIDYISASGFWVGGLLSTHGYSVTQTDAEVLGFLQELNVYDAVVKVELSVPSDDRTGEGNARFQEFKNRLGQLVKMFEQPGFLGGLGATTGGASLSSQLLATGISRDAKDIVYEDTDHIPARFKKGMHKAPGVEILTAYVEGEQV